MAEPISLQIPGYEILAKLGEGGMGTVYKARQLSLDRLVAIKTLPPQFADSADYVEHFLREARTEATLKHPNIVQIHEAGNVGSTYYFIMEYVSGYTVASWLERKGRLPESEVLSIAEAVGRALDYAWEKAEIIHGDIKPGNMLIDEDGTIKLGDFLALTVPGRSGSRSIFADFLLGTPNYMSPEQLRGEEFLDCRSDIYSLGAVLYHLLTGRLPFAELSGEDLYEKQLHLFLEDVQSVEPAVGAPTAWLLDKMLIRDLQQRPARWTDVLHDLVQVRMGLPPHAPLPEEGSSAMRRSPDRHGPVEPATARGTRTVRIRIRPSDLPGDAPEEAEPDGEKAEQRSRIVPAVLMAAALLALGVVFCLPPPPEEELAPIPELAWPMDQPAAAPAPPPAIDLEPPARPAPSPPAAPEAPEFQAAPAADVAADISPAARAEALREYSALMNRVMKITRTYQDAEAVRLLEAWLQSHPGHAYTDAAQLQLARVSRMGDLFAEMERRRAQLKGVYLKLGPNREGVVTDVEGGKIRITRRIQESGEARIWEELRSLSTRSLDDLLEAADAERLPEHRATLRLAAGEFTEAERLLDQARRAGRDMAELTAWLTDWRAIAGNIAAYKQVAEISALASGGRAEEARRRMEIARSELSDTDVFRWSEVELIQTMETTLRPAVAEAPSPPTADAGQAAETPAPATPEAVAESTEDVAPPVVVDPGEVAANQIPRMTIGQLHEQYVSLDGRMVRLRFQYRANIEQLTAATYATSFLEDGLSVRVTFSEEALKWVRGLPTTQKNSPKTVFGIVDSTDRVMKLIGRSQRALPGGSGAEYSW